MMKSVLLFAVFSISCFSSSQELPTSGNNVYGNILKTMKLNHTMNLRNLGTLLTSLGLHDCSEKAEHSHQCVTPLSLFNFHNLSTTKSLNEMDFRQFSTMIIYSLLPQPRKHSTRMVTKKVDVYEELLKRYHTPGMCEQTIDQVLKDLNESIGKQLNSTHKCFSSREILREQNISLQAEITKANLPDLAIVIVSNLLNRYCIRIAYEMPLPCSSFFVSKLFNKYAKNNHIDKQAMRPLLKNLKIGKQEAFSGKQDKEDHKHRKRRRLVKRDLNISDNEKCYSVDELFSIYHVDEETGFKLKRFERLSAALLEQIDSNACVSQKEEEIEQENTKERGKSNKGRGFPSDRLPDVSVWGFGLAAVSMVSLCSLMMIIPLMKTNFFQKSLVFLIALAVGTLIGDAVFHLLPHAIGFKSSSSPLYAYDDKSYLWKFLSAGAGVYGLFVFESITHLILRKSRSVAITSSKKKDVNLAFSKPEAKVNSPPKPPEKPPLAFSNKVAQKEDELNGEKFADAHKMDMSEDDEEEKPIAPMAWTVIIGDTLHNIADGIAIGVAFTDSIYGGISTSIAVLCHEVPHELGDFVVLLSAGMSVRQAVLANFVSALFCFIGLILGKLIGEIEDVNLWILGVTAGFFLYIALSNKLPELIHVSVHCDLPKRTIIILQNTGVILGYTGMFFLAYYKTDINF